MSEPFKVSNGVCQGRGPVPLPLPLADSGGGGAGGVRPPFEIPKRDPPKSRCACGARGSRCAPPPLSTNPGSAPAFSVYMDDLAHRLNKCLNGCVNGGRSPDKPSNVAYAGDLVVLSLYSTGLQQLLSEFGIQNDIR